jgi:hypothetical protein
VLHAIVPISSASRSDQGGSLLTTLELPTVLEVLRRLTGTGAAEQHHH